MGIDREMLQAIGQLMDVKLDPIKADIAGLKQTVTELAQSHDELRQSQEGLKQTVDGLVQSQDELRRSHNELRRSHDELRRSHDELRRSHDELRQSQEGLKQTVTKLERKLEEQDEFERGTRILIEGMDKNIRLLAEGHQINADKIRKLDRIEATLNDVKSEVEVIKQVVSWHSEAIMDSKA